MILETTMSNSHCNQQGFVNHIFTPKGDVKFACWNVHTPGKPTKQNVHLRELLEEKNIEFAALSEVRWHGQGAVELHGSTFLYSDVS